MRIARLRETDGRPGRVEMGFGVVISRLSE